MQFYEEAMGFSLAIDQWWSKIYRIGGGAHVGLVDEAMWARSMTGGVPNPGTRSHGLLSFKSPAPGAIHSMPTVRLKGRAPNWGSRLNAAWLSYAVREHASARS